MAYFDTQCLEALQKIGTELQKIREIMEIDQIEEEQETKDMEEQKDLFFGIFEKVYEPHKGEIVLMRSKDGKSMYPVEIIDGCLLRNGRLSNFWIWKNLFVGEIENGYGCFYKPIERKEEIRNFCKKR